MFNEFIARQKIIEKRIEEKMGCNIDMLKQNRTDIKQMYQSKFSSLSISGISNFNTIYCNICSKKQEDLELLVEKCIKRAIELEKFVYLFQEDGFMIDEIKDEIMFCTIMQYDIIPLEVLWGMETFEKAENVLNSKEQIIFRYLKHLAQFYLDETNKIVESLNEEKNKKMMAIKENAFQFVFSPGV